MRRLSLWMRRHPMFGDSVLAGVLLLADLGSVGSWFARHDPWIYWPVGALLVVPVVFRRREPVLVAYLVLAGGAIQLVTHGDLLAAHGLAVRGADLSLGFALYTLVAYVNRRVAAGYAGLLLVGTGAWTVWRVQNVNTAWAVVVGVLLIFGFCWVLGEFVGARRAYDAEVRRRLQLVETERDQHTRIAVAAERTRIARELHDVVAHAVSVIVVQADGAEYALRTDPDLAGAAMRTIAETGRRALVELRSLLDVLRRDIEPGESAGTGPDGRAPQPDIAALPDLAHKVTEIGLPVELDLVGDLTGLPAAVGLGVYRIAQEALTNTLKHAGPGASAAVRVRRVGDVVGGFVEVEVCDDGRGTPELVGEFAAVSGGNGLIGMRERASVLGGALEAGPLASGGWRVRARFPVRSGRPAPLPSS